MENKLHYQVQKCISLSRKARIRKDVLCIRQCILHNLMKGFPRPVFGHYLEQSKSHFHQVELEFSILTLALTLIHISKMFHETQAQCSWILYRPQSVVLAQHSLKNNPMPVMKTLSNGQCSLQ